MKIADRTPYRTENGTIDLIGRAQGTLKYGLSWFARLRAQDTVIAVMEKVLGANFVLLRNITLPDTDINLPLVLIGPPGLYLINVIHERGVYRARDDEWGTIAGEKLVPASINQLQRTIKLGRVLQVYLDRAGFKGAVLVEPILMAADPGMHIESVRAAARIVMSDALERFAISMNQARPVINAVFIGNLAQVIVNGPKNNSLVPTAVAPPAPVQASAGSDNNSVPHGSQPVQGANSDFSANSLGFSFDDKSPETPASQPQYAAQPQPSAPQNNDWQNTPTFLGNPADFRKQNGAAQEQVFLSNESGDADFRNAVFQDDTPQALEPQRGSPTFQFSDDPRSEQPATQLETPQHSAVTPARKTGLLGLTRKQLLILVGILLCWLCSMAVFAVYLYSSLYA